MECATETHIKCIGRNSFTDHFCRYNRIYPEITNGFKTGDVASNDWRKLVYSSPVSLGLRILLLQLEGNQTDEKNWEAPF